MSAMGLYLRLIGQCPAHELHRDIFGRFLAEPPPPALDARVAIQLWKEEASVRDHG